MSDLKMGQIVAVADYIQDAYVPRVYIREGERGHLCKDIGDNLEAPGGKWWRECRPAEEVWPELFFAKEIRAVDQALHAVEMESEPVQRLRRQIAWLCRELGRRPNCCPPVTHCVVEKPCSTCWEEASLEAAKKGESHA